MPLISNVILSLKTNLIYDLQVKSVHYMWDDDMLTWPKMINVFRVYKKDNACVTPSKQHTLYRIIYDKTTTFWGYV